MWAKKFEALAAPPLALKNGGKEVLRAAIVDGDLHISIVRGFDAPDAWGILIADIARHASRIFARESGIREEEALVRIVDMFQAEIERPTDTGTTDAIQ